MIPSVSPSGDFPPIPGQLVLPGMPSPAVPANGQAPLPGLEFPEVSGPRAGDPELAAVAGELRALDGDGSRMAAAIRGALDMLLDGQHTGRYRWDQLHKTEKTQRLDAGRDRPGPRAAARPTARRWTTRSRARTWTASSRTGWAAG